MTRSRVDSNQPAIVEALEGAHFSVLSLANVRHGCPDLLVAWPGGCVLLEVKAKNGRLTEDERSFFATWRGPAYVVRSPTEALNRMLSLVAATQRLPAGHLVLDGQGAEYNP